jgi:hypothetical protein
VRAALAAPVAALALLAGCGGDDQSRTPAETATAFYEAAGQRDGDAACGLADARYTRQIEYDNPSCEGAFDSAGGFGRDGQDAKVLQVDEHVQTALVTVRLPAFPKLFTCLSRAESEWKVDAINPNEPSGACRSRTHATAGPSGHLASAPTTRVGAMPSNH